MDGLTTSEYLQETARRNIEGEISIDEAQELIHNYYITKTAHDAGDADKEEADRVSGNIAKLLSSNTLNFSVFGYTQVHRNIFNGVFKEGFVRMLHPETPRHPRQKYLLTVKGVGLYNQITAATPSPRSTSVIFHFPWL